MKCYVFVHSHLSSIQKGIQAAHVVADLVWSGSNPQDPAYLWQRDYKTLILIEGGNSWSLDMWEERIRKTSYHWTSFTEDEDTLYNLKTAVGFIYDDKERNFLEEALMKSIEDWELAR